MCSDPSPIPSAASSRDLYIPPGDFGYWQGALRDRDDASYAELHNTIAARVRLAIYLLYSDHEGGQRTISLFSLSPADGTDSVWLTSVVRHWNLRPGRSPLELGGWEFAAKSRFLASQQRGNEGALFTPFDR